MEVNPIVIINDERVAHIAFVYYDTVFTHERCNIDQVKERQDYKATDLSDAVEIAVNHPARLCEICWPNERE